MNETEQQIKWKDYDASALNVYIENLTLSRNLSENYKLETNWVLVKNAIKIMRVELTIYNYVVNNKVFDGNYETTLKYIDQIKLDGVIPGDKVTLKSENVKAYFANSSIGPDKTIYVNAHDALEGLDKNNYYIGILSNNNTFGEYLVQYKLKGTIYPDKLKSTDGSVELRNVRGLTDLNMINLIPLDAKLYVNKIEKDTEKYVEIYPNVADFLSRRNVFAVGYELILKDSSDKAIPISSNLHLAILSTGEINDLISITDNGTFRVEYDKEGSGIVIDLSQLNNKFISHIVLTEESQLLKPWQIVLIIVGAVVLVGGGVTAAIIIRKKKQGSYGKFDKI